MLELSDQNMATNPQCYKDREDYIILDACGYNQLYLKEHHYNT